MSSDQKDPFAIAERLMEDVRTPMLGCENAWIAAGAFLAALKNAGMSAVTQELIGEALQRTKRQAVGGYCGLTGICGVVPAIGACFSVLLGAACPKDAETVQTMRVAGRVVRAVANLAGPCCCKAFVRIALVEAAEAARELFGVSLTGSPETACAYVERHPHGCRKERCPYYALK